MFLTGHADSIVLFAEHPYNGKNQISSERQAFYRQLSKTFTNYFSYRDSQGFRNNYIYTKASTIEILLYVTFDKAEMDWLTFL